MVIIPAIDLHEGRVVRLTKGAFEAKTVYSGAPADVMQKWQSEGAKLVHVIDLDGAVHGGRRNLGSLKNILAVAKVPIQFGGGLRSYESVAEILSAGVWRAIVGTKAFDTELIKRLVRDFRDRIVVGVDVREGVIQTQGWKASKRGVTLKTFFQRLEDLRIKTIIYTDVSRDGTMKGLNIKALKKLLNATSMNVIVSGGVSSLKDLKQLLAIQAKNLEGAIVGRALYEQKISLPEALKLVITSN